MKFILTFVLITGSLFAQTDFTMPTYVVFGGAFSQLTGWNAFASAAIPVSHSVGIYSLSSADLVPVSIIDSDGIKRLTVSCKLREELLKTLYTNNKLQLLLGAGTGVKVSGSSNNIYQNTNNLTPDVIAAIVYQVSPHFAITLPVRVEYISSKDFNKSGWWNIIPELGLIWKP